MDATTTHPLVLIGKMMMAAELAKTADDWDKVFNGLAHEYRAHQAKHAFKDESGAVWVTRLAVTADGNVLCSSEAKDTITLTRSEHLPLGSYETLQKMVAELRTQNAALLASPTGPLDAMHRKLFKADRYQVLYRHTCALFFMLLGTNSLRVDFGSQLETYMRRGRREECLVRLAVLESIVTREAMAYGKLQEDKAKGIK